MIRYDLHLVNGGGVSRITKDKNQEVSDKIRFTKDLVELMEEKNKSSPQERRRRDGKKRL